MLPRIAVVYGACGLLYLSCNWRALVAIGSATLLGYWLAMSYIPLPDGTPANLDRGTTWQPGSTVNSWPDTVGTNQDLGSGRCAQYVSGSGNRPDRRIEWDLDPQFTNRGTPHVRIAAGRRRVPGGRPRVEHRVSAEQGTMDELVCALHRRTCHGRACRLFWITDVRQVRWWTPPAVAYGTNALAVYVAAATARTDPGRDSLGEFGGSSANAEIVAFWHGFASWLPPSPASLAYAVTERADPARRGVDSVS